MAKGFNVPNRDQNKKIGKRKQQLGGNRDNVWSRRKLKKISDPQRHTGRDFWNRCSFWLTSNFRTL